ncbi:MAG: nicotinate-nucleotide adenylyltransferase [Blastocatellia bacterium]
MAERIGVYGGTFDPPHLGHLAIAERLVSEFSLDHLLMVPAATPPHKRRQTISSPFHRLAMLALATAESAKIYVSPLELEPAATPYTVDTLRRLQQNHPEAHLYFVMGADSFRDLSSWHRFEELLIRYSTIVAMRPGFPGKEATNWQELAGNLPTRFQELVVDLRGGRHLLTEQMERPQIYLTDYVSVDVSATNIRLAVAEGGSLHDLVPPSVATYIKKYQLYSHA